MNTVSIVPGDFHVLARVTVFAFGLVVAAGLHHILASDAVDARTLPWNRRVLARCTVDACTDLGAPCRLNVLPGYAADALCPAIGGFTVPARGAKLTVGRT